MKNPEYKKRIGLAKRLIALVMVVVFAFSTVTPACARPGNYGNSSSFNQVVTGAYSGLQASSSGSWGHIASDVGQSIAVEAACLWYYNNYYSESGKSLIAFNIGGTRVDISRGQMFRMVASVAAQAVAGVASGQGFSVGSIVGGMVDSFVNLLAQEIIRDMLVRRFGMEPTLAGLVTSIASMIVPKLMASLAGLDGSSESEAAPAEDVSAPGTPDSEETSGSGEEAAPAEASASSEKATSNEKSASYQTAEARKNSNPGWSFRLGSKLGGAIDKKIDPKGKLYQATSFMKKVWGAEKNLDKKGDTKVTGKQLKAGIELSDRAISSKKDDREKLSEKLASQQRSGDSKGAANTEKELKAVDAKIAQYEAFKSALQGFYAKINNNPDASIAVRSVLAGVVKSVDSIGSKRAVNKAVIGVARMVGGDKEADYAAGKVDSASLDRSIKRGVAASVGYKGNIDNEPALQKAIKQDTENRQDAQKYGIRYNPNDQAGFQRALEKAKAAPVSAAAAQAAAGKERQDSSGTALPKGNDGLKKTFSTVPDDSGNVKAVPVSSAAAQAVAGEAGQKSPGVTMDAQVTPLSPATNVANQAAMSNDIGQEKSLPATKDAATETPARGTPGGVDLSTRDLNMDAATKAQLVSQGLELLDAAEKANAAGKKTIEMNTKPATKDAATEYYSVPKVQKLETQIHSSY